MDTVKRAVWFIEMHLAEPLRLDEIAEAAGTTRFALSHVFVATTGMTTLGYVRARRLGEAAKALAAGAPDILDLALQAGYGSHEAFSRAFRDAFGLSPSTLRERRALDPKLVTEAFHMTKPVASPLAPPRFEEGAALLLAGLSERMTLDQRSRIPGIWQRFVPHLGAIPGQVGRTTYGASLDYDPQSESMTYLSAVEVSSKADLPKDFVCAAIPAQRYAVFRHAGHVSTIGSTLVAIFDGWAPDCGFKFGDKPACLERYGREFDGRSGEGGFEILVPVAG
jgi:AraC family transcriptional regulator